MSVGTRNRLKRSLCVLFWFEGVGVFRHLRESWACLKLTLLMSVHFHKVSKGLWENRKEGGLCIHSFTLSCLCAEFFVGHSLLLTEEVYNFHLRVSIFLLLLLLSSWKPVACVRHSWASQTCLDPPDFFLTF